MEADVERQIKVLQDKENNSKKSQNPKEQLRSLLFDSNYCARQTLI